MDTKNTITCPICEEEFVDRRGLTSHARYKHKLGKEELEKVLENEEEGESDLWKILGSIGATLIALISIGKLR